MCLYLMIYIVIGKSAAGKNKVAQLIKENMPSIKPIITTTSRPMQEGEKQDVDYHFVSKDEFLNKVAAEEFIEYVSNKTVYRGHPAVWYYGTTKDAINPDEDCVIVVDPDGADSLICEFGRDKCKVVLVDAHNRVRCKRAMERSTVSMSEWRKRAEEDDAKFGRIRFCYDCVIDNNEDVSDEVIWNKVKQALSNC